MQKILRRYVFKSLFYLHANIQNILKISYNAIYQFKNAEIRFLPYHAFEIFPQRFSEINSGNSFFHNNSIAAATLWLANYYHGLLIDIHTLVFYAHLYKILKFRKNSAATFLAK